MFALLILNDILVLSQLDLPYDNPCRIKYNE